jgi:hypothetical protein
VFALAMGAVTTVEATAKRPLASLLGSRPPSGASTSVGVVVGAVGCTDTSGSKPLRHLAADIGAHDGAGRGGHDDRAGGGRAQHHGALHHCSDHDHFQYPGTGHPAALT